MDIFIIFSLSFAKVFIPGCYASYVVYGTWRGNIINSIFIKIFTPNNKYRQGWDGFDYGAIPSYDD